MKALSSRSSYRADVPKNIGGKKFWNCLDTHGNRTALIDTTTARSMSYRALATAVVDGARRLTRSGKGLVCIALRNDLEGVLCYLSALASGHAVLVCSQQELAGGNSSLLSRYEPDVILWRENASPVELAPHRHIPLPEIFGYKAAASVAANTFVHPDLALLLLTSGSTGSSKSVRLSYANIASAARQVASALRMEAHERTLLSLSLHHIYGLSVLHSSLEAGGCLILGASNVMRREFWGICQAQSATLISLVPTQLKFISSIATDKIPIPAGLKLTTSGAALDASTREWLASMLINKGASIYSMYGMTESAGRIAVLAPEEFTTTPTSEIGRASCRERVSPRV